MYDYTAANQDELSFSKGQLINILDKTNPDWWKGEVNWVTGLLPTNYVKMTTDSDPSQQCEFLSHPSFDLFRNTCCPNYGGMGRGRGRGHTGRLTRPWVADTDCCVTWLPWLPAGDSVSMSEHGNTDGKT